MCVIWFTCSIVFWFLVAYYVYFKLSASRHWSRHGVPHLRPIFLVGNTWRANITENFFESLEKIYNENKGKKLIGYWVYTRPQVIVTDLDVTRRILINDFDSFRDRGFEIDEELEPLAGHLFQISGKRWRNLRVKLTPTFTSGKMKLMFPAAARCGEELRTYLREPARRGDPLDVKDLLSSFTTDVISSCAFGIETNSLRNPDSEFLRFGKKIFNGGIRSTASAVLAILYPRLSRILSVRLIPEDVSDFFTGTVREMVEFREKNNVTRNDFLQLLIRMLRTGKVEDADREPEDVGDADDRALVQTFSLEQAAAQCFVFFAGGFETSSTALTFALYELALNPDIQEKLQNEVDEKVSELGLTYEAMTSMTYMDMVIKETMRKYPPIGFLQRKCNADYDVPEVKARIPKGSEVIISVRGFHNDPDLFPDPDKFNPERFDSEHRNTRAYLPFGDGPRNCIGSRFANMQMKVCLMSILKDYTVEVTQKTPIPVTYGILSLTPSARGGMLLSFTRRN